MAQEIVEAARPIDWRSALSGLIRAGALASENPEPDTKWTEALSPDEAQKYFKALANAGALASRNPFPFPDES